MGFNLRAAVKDSNKFGHEVDTGEASFLTGLDVLDFMTGGIHPETKKMYVGLRNGRILGIIGKSGAGKSALAVKIANAMTEEYDNGVVFHDDFEKAADFKRLVALTDTPEEILRQRWNLINDASLSTDLIYEQVTNISDMKLANKQELMLDIECPWQEQEADPCMPPTVILIDSQKLMRPKKYVENNEDASGNNMTGGQTANANNEMYTNINRVLLEANIMPIVVNHITKRINTGFTPEPALMNFLKQDENLPGGSTSMYLSDTLIKVEAGKKLIPEKDFGIKGFHVKLTLCKSRSNAAGIPIDHFVYEQKSGFCNVLTNFNFLKDKGCLKGSPRAYYWEGYEDVKFTAKTYREKYWANEGLQEHVDTLLGEHLPSLMGQLDVATVESEEE